MFMFRNKVQNSFHSLGKKKQTNKKIKIWKVDHGVVWNLNMTEHDENPNNTVSSTVFNPQVCTDDALKKGISSWFFFSESLARLAYNKGTALFRGNDPFSKTFSLTHHPHRQMKKTCWTGVETEKWQSDSFTAHAHGKNASTRRGQFHRSGFDSSRFACLVSQLSCCIKQTVK